MKEEQKKEKVKKLKPVSFVKGQYGYYRDNTFQQNLLLKAMLITQDPQELEDGWLENCC